MVSRGPLNADVRQRLKAASLIQRKSLLYVVLAAVILTGIAFALRSRENHRTLEGALLLSSLPSSVSSIRCRTPPTSGVRVICTFTVDPSDFQQLLVGLPFADVEPEVKSAHDFPNVDGLGRNFGVGYRYRVEPSQSGTGSAIDVLADREHRHVLIRLSIH
jgi:hypothetical protein